MSEKSLLTGILEETNEPYAIAKIAGLKMCEAYNRQYGTQFVAVKTPLRSKYVEEAGWDVSVVLDEPEFAGIDAGIVLQAYLPDSHAALERLGVPSGHDGDG